MSPADHIAAHLCTPFAWGSHDCVTFASAWVMQSTGKDCLAGLGTWSTAPAAARAIKRAGGLVSAIDARLPRVEPSFARDGDIALCDGIVMIFSGAHLVGPGKRGLVFVSRCKAEHAWSVER